MPLTAKLIEGHSLSETDVADACEALLSESVSLEEKAAFLRALRTKGETPAEIAAFVQYLLTKARVPHLDGDDVLDVCGTGGDRLGLFNISTASMFVVAACGVKVVKHGNRGITSKSGGADVLEALGVSIEQPPERAGEILDAAGCVFLFAPAYHPAFKAIAPVRKMLAEEGVTTIFNMLGPLLNPARPAYQLAGVYDEALLPVYAEVFRLLGRKAAWAVHGRAGDSGLDEISTVGPSNVYALKDRQISRWQIDPMELGVDHHELEVLRGGSAVENSRLIEEMFAGQITGPRLDIVLLNAAASLVVTGRTSDLTAGLVMAREAVREGRAADVLRRLRSA